MDRSVPAVATTVSSTSVECVVCYESRIERAIAKDKILGLFARVNCNLVSKVHRGVRVANADSVQIDHERRAAGGLCVDSEIACPDRKWVPCKIDINRNEFILAGRATWPGVHTNRVEVDPVHAGKQADAFVRVKLCDE